MLSPVFPDQLTDKPALRNYSRAYHPLYNSSAQSHSPTSQRAINQIYDQMLTVIPSLLTSSINGFAFLELILFCDNTIVFRDRMRLLFALIEATNPSVNRLPLKFRLVTCLMLFHSSGAISSVIRFPFSFNAFILGRSGRSLKI